MLEYNSAMTTEAQNLLRRALELGDEERAEIAGLLFQSLDPPDEAGVDEAWRKEIRRRLRLIEEGEAEWIPWDDVRAELRARLHGEG